MTKQKIIHFLRVISRWGICLLLLVIIIISIRLLVVDSCFVPSDSMMPTISPGDYVLMNKASFGARFFNNYEFVKTGKRPDIYRIGGFRKIKRNDILIFNFPYKKRNKLILDLNSHYIKRCVAIPGDTLIIENGFYKVKNCIDTLGVFTNQLHLSQMKDSDIDVNVLKSFPKKSKYRSWTIKDFGPLYIPKAKECLKIDSTNIELYKNLIEYETGLKVTNANNNICLNDSIIKDYTFLLNYYFMTGDNVLNSRDSRYWGLLPEDHIVGVASIIWKSKDIESGDYRWSRFFNLIK